MIGTKKIVYNELTTFDLKVIAVYDNSPKCARCIFADGKGFKHLCLQNEGMINCSINDIVWIEDTRK